MKTTVIITAGGIGKRMGNKLPKQFIELNGKAILLRTLENFYAFNPSAQFIITIPSEWKNYWEEMMIQTHCQIPHRLVEGGKERYDSVKNALSVCTGDIIAIHDAVRPFVSLETLNRCLHALSLCDAVIPTIPLKESLREKLNEESKALNRINYCLVQTPQCFHSPVLRKAYNLPFHDGITDDASLVEEAGFKVHLVDGNEENIKITTTYDLLLAQAILTAQDQL
jgi:2-C-methyl-D-erythritol 4-phosphate cytidylyltransferase